MIPLTQDSSFLIGDVAKLLGYILSGIFKFLDMFGIENIGLCIILFTFFVKLVMFPLTLKQQKFSKLSSIMQPELQAIQNKYKDKKDNESMLKMQEETKEVYAKYGTSMSAGCVQLIIQMPIIFALYRVVYNIPAYVPSVKVLFTNILGTDGTTGIMSDPNFQTIMADNFGAKADLTLNTSIDLLKSFSTENWNKLAELFPSMADTINTSAEHYSRMNDFLGIDLGVAPGFKLSIALAIPILSALTQWISVKLSMAQNPNTGKTNEENPMAASMGMMNNIMPLMSAFFCLTLPAGLGVYWIASAVFQIIQQLGINYYFKKVDLNDIIKKNIEKNNKKRAKKGLPPQQVNKKANVYAKTVKSAEQKAKELDDRKKEIEESTKYYKSNSGKKGSIASKAGMVKQYNERNNK